MSIVTRTWKQQPGDYFCVSTKSKEGEWKDKFFHRDNLDQVDDFVEANRDKNLYWCPHGFSSKRRLKQHAVLPKLLWSDLDEIDPRGLDPQPTIAWESSPNRYAALWKLDKTMSEDLNRALSYHVGADKSGWDLTQVLRIPGSANYKYGPKGVPGRLLWGNGPTHELAILRKLTGAEKPEEKSKGKFKGPDAVEVYRRYEKHIAPKTRRDLKAQQATAGKRSEVIWRMWHDLFDAGMLIDEAIACIKASVWNKYAGRRSEDDQLYREAEKILEERLNNPNRPKSSDKGSEAGSEDAEAGPESMFVRMSDVKEANVDWLIPGWVPYGAITIVEGDPGIGKSYLVQFLSVCVTDGKKFPSRRGYREKPEPGAVLYFDIENDPESVTKPRLLDNECMNLDNYLQSREILSLDLESDFEMLETLIKFTQPKMVVFDTINTYLGQSDTHKASDVQRSLSHLTALSRDHHFGLVILRHLTKGSKDKVQYRGQGSIAFLGMARVVHLVAKHPREEDMLVVKTVKMNFGKPEKPLKYFLEELPPKLGRDERSRLVIDDFDDTVTDEELNAPAKEKKKNDDQKRAEDLIKEMVKDKGVERDRIGRTAEARGIGEKTLERASIALNVRKEVLRGRTYWYLD